MNTHFDFEDERTRDYANSRRIALGHHASDKWYTWIGRVEGVLQEEGRFDVITCFLKVSSIYYPSEYF